MKDLSLTFTIQKLWSLLLLFFFFRINRITDLAICRTSIDAVALKAEND